MMQTLDLLAFLPSKPSDDPRSEICARLHGFTSDIARQVEGMPNSVVLGSTSLPTSRGLIQTINPSFEQFRRAIRSTAPQFRPPKKEITSIFTICVPKKVGMKEVIQKMKMKPVMKMKQMIQKMKMVMYHRHIPHPNKVFRRYT